MRITKATLQEKQDYNGDGRLYAWIRIAKKKCPIEVSFPRDRSFVRYDLVAPIGHHFGPTGDDRFIFFDQKRLLRAAGQMSIDKCSTDAGACAHLSAD